MNKMKYLAPVLFNCGMFVMVRTGVFGHKCR